MTQVHSYQKTVNGKLITVHEHQRGGTGHMATWHPQPKDVKWGKVLHNKNEGHDKIYKVSIAHGPDDKFHVIAQWGKNGKALAQQHKGAPQPTLEAARLEAGEFLEPKYKKGYNLAHTSVAANNIKNLDPIHFHEAGIDIKHAQIEEPKGLTVTPEMVAKHEELKEEAQPDTAAFKTALESAQKITGWAEKHGQKTMMEPNAANYAIAHEFNMQAAEAWTKASHLAPNAKDASTCKAQAAAHAASAKVYNEAFVSAQALEKFGHVPSEPLASSEELASEQPSPVDEAKSTATEVPKGTKKGHYLMNTEGKPQWFPFEVGTDVQHATLAQRTVIGENKNKGWYVRATNSADAKKIQEAIYSVTGEPHKEGPKMSGANHHGNKSAFPHFFFGKGPEGKAIAEKVMAKLNDASDTTPPKAGSAPEPAKGAEAPAPPVPEPAPAEAPKKPWHERDFHAEANKVWTEDSPLKAIHDHFNAVKSVGPAPTDKAGVKDYVGHTKNLAVIAMHKHKAGVPKPPHFDDSQNWETVAQKWASVAKKAEAHLKTME